MCDIVRDTQTLTPCDICQIWQALVKGSIVGHLHQDSHRYLKPRTKTAERIKLIPCNPRNCLLQVCMGRHSMSHVYCLSAGAGTIKVF